MRSLALILVIALTGCSSGIPSHVQSREYAVYRVFLADFSSQHPSATNYLYVYASAAGTPFFNGSRQSRRSPCIPQAADDAFWKVRGKEYLLDASDPNWHRLPNGRFVPLVEGGDTPIPHTTVSFSRIFFDPNGKDAYFQASIGYCSVGCGHYSIIWHAVQAQGGWAFQPTACHSES